MRYVQWYFAPRWNISTLQLRSKLMNRNKGSKAESSNSQERIFIFPQMNTSQQKNEASGKWILYVTACDRCDAEDHSNLCQVYFDNFFFLFYKHYSSNRAHVLIVKLHHWLFPWNLRYLWRKNILLIWQGNSEFVLFDLAKYISIRKKCSWIILIFILYFSYNPDYDSEVSYGEV